MCLSARWGLRGEGHGRGALAAAWGEVVRLRPFWPGPRRVGGDVDVAFILGLRCSRRARISSLLRLARLFVCVERAISAIVAKVGRDRSRAQQKEINTQRREEDIGLREGEENQKIVPGGGVYEGAKLA